jgi:hypothetical protein
MDRPARQPDTHACTRAVHGKICCGAGDGPTQKPKNHVEKPNSDRDSDQAQHKARETYHLVVVMRVIAVDLEALVAIAAFDKAGVLRDGKPDARMTQSAIASVACNFPGGDKLCFGGGDWHGGVVLNI